jgi:hypothetical protein
MPGARLLTFGHAPVAAGMTTRVMALPLGQGHILDGKASLGHTRGNLAGVTRAELQARIKRGELPSFDGTVGVDDLLGLYPATRLTDDRALERLERIKAAALGRDIASRSLPEPRVLAERLSVLGQHWRAPGSRPSTMPEYWRIWSPT